MGTVAVGVVLICVVTLVIRKMIKNKKNRKSSQCGCDCSNCGENCRH